MGELQKRLRSVRSKVWGTNDYAPDSLCCAAADALDAQDAELGRCQAEIVRLTEDVETWRVEASTSRRDMKKLAQDLDEYQANVSESMDHTTAYEAELKVDRDHWRKLCQDGWVEVADGPVSRKLREDLASFMMSRSFATGHGDSHTDLLGELGPQIDELRARAEAAENSGWVIEGQWSPTDSPDYWIGSSAWTTDHMRALRFARREDAQQAADLMLSGVNVRICLHEWETAARGGA